RKGEKEREGKGKEMKGKNRKKKGKGKERKGKGKEEKIRLPQEKYSGTYTMKTDGVAGDKEGGRK
uniref:Uncharacterized protein n=1 Tax=Otolemur garnettii TaxID=30611 RepID=H0XRH3_OTOGA